MKFQYKKDDDVLMIDLASDKIDYAEQTGDLVMHFSSKRKAVLLEILDASEFLQNAIKTIPEKLRYQILSPNISVN